MQCELCKDTRYIPVDAKTVKVCICAHALALREHLGPEIASAVSLKSSPLLDPTKGKNGGLAVDLTTSNLFLHGHWDDIRSHLKWALAYKGPRFHFKVVTDENLRNVYVGDESYARKSRKTREEEKTFNNLQSFIGEDVPLVIIRLGFLGWGNKAMPGILKETLMIRYGLRLPTWVVEDTTNPFQDTYSYSAEVAAFLRDKFQEIRLGEEKKGAVQVGTSKGDKLAPTPPEEDGIALQWGGNSNFNRGSGFSTAKKRTPAQGGVDSGSDGSDLDLKSSTKFKKKSRSPSNSW